LKNKNHLKTSKISIIKKNYISIILIGIILVANFLIADYLRTDYLNFVWSADDATYIAVAYTFKENNNFGSGYMSSALVTSKPLDTLINQYPTISFFHAAKGPVFFILLGSFYKILNTAPPNMFLHASIFTNILTSAFLILFYFFMKSKFDTKIAFISSFILVFMSTFVILGARVHPFILVMLFSVLILFFLEKKTHHYFIGGFFAALAPLSHPFGIFVTISYFLFILTRGEFKGLLFSTISLFGTISPYMLLNYYYLGDIGWGFYVPFSDSISKLISFIPRSEEFTRISPYTDHFLHFSKDRFYDTFTVFTTIFNKIGIIYKIQLLIIFLFASSLAFVKIDKLKNYSLSIISFVSVFIIGFVLTSSYLLRDTYFHAIFVFAVFPITILVIYKKFRTYFENNDRQSLFILLLVYVTAIGIYLTSIMLGRPDPTLRLILPALIFLIPFAVYGINKVVTSTFNKKRYATIGFFVVIALLLFPVFDQMVDGINYQRWKVQRTNNLQTEEVATVNQYIYNNFPKGTNFVSNEPGFTFLYTGQNAIGLPKEDISVEQFEKLIDHYKISYIVGYNENVAHIPSINPLLERINQWQPYQYYYKQIYNQNNSKILEVNSILLADISEPSLYTYKAMKLEKEGKFHEANSILEEIKNFKLENVNELTKICSVLTQNNKFDYSIHFCNRIITKDPNNLTAQENLVISYESKGNTEKVYVTLNYYDEIFVNEPKNEKTLQSWAKSIQYLSQKKEYQNIVLQLYENAIQYREQRDYGKALNAFSRLVWLNPDFDIITLSYYSLIQILTDLEDYEAALKEYDRFIQIFKQEMINLAEANKPNEANEIQKIMIEFMKGKANLLTNLEDYHKAQSVYNAILGYDKFDPDVWKKIASYLEKYDQLPESLYAYELAQQLEPENDYLLEKIEVLKDKIANIR